MLSQLDHPEFLNNHHTRPCRTHRSAPYTRTSSRMLSTYPELISRNKALTIVSLRSCEWYVQSLFCRQSNSSICHFDVFLCCILHHFLFEVSRLSSWAMWQSSFVGMRLCCLASAARGILRFLASFHGWETLSIWLYTQPSRSENYTKR